MSPKITLELTQAQIDSIQKGEEVTIKKDDGMPQDGTLYSFIMDCSDSHGAKWVKHYIDFHRYDTGNYFLTKEEANKRAEAWKALARVNKYIREEELRGGDYAISLNENLSLDWYYSAYSIISNLKSKEAVQQVIDNCEEDCKLVLSELRFYT